jgi:subtilisin family serine protease
VQIFSTFPATDNFYFNDSSGGTSYSAPYVSGALALMLARFPSLTYTQIISLLLAATDPLPSLAGKCVTGGRLNLRNALSPPLRLKTALSAGQPSLALHVSAGPNQSCVIQASTNLSNWSPIVTNSTSGSGSFDYIDPQFTNAPRRFYRAVSTP